MEMHEQETPWLKRVEELISILEGTTIGELELTEAGMEIVIRRRPDMMMVSVPMQQLSVTQQSMQSIPEAVGTAGAKEDHSVPITAPLTGVYYSSPSPTSPPFIALGDVVHVGQVVALVEAMKVFNEVQSEAAGRVVDLTATNGDVVQKGDVLIRVEP